MPAQVLAGQDGLTQLVRRVEDLERNQREMQSLLVRNGTFQSPNFDGVAATDTVGTLGYGLDGPTGNAVFNNIALRGGIIGNDALTAPVTADVGNNATTGGTCATGVTVTTATITFTVPSGFSTAYVMAVAESDCSLPGGGSIQVVASIGGTSGNPATAFGSGGAINGTSPFSRKITGLTGGVSTIVVLAKLTYVGSPSTTATGVDGNVSATVIYFR